ncbi:acyl-CoA dehydrogenase family protein [Yinghuangia aomiensis]
MARSRRGFAWRCDGASPDPVPVPSGASARPFRRPARCAADREEYARGGEPGATGPAATPATTAGDREALRSTLRAFFTEHGAEDAVRRLMTAESGHDHAVWTLITRQLGLTALGLPEEYGGVRGPAELAVACTEAGRALLGAPLLSHNAGRAGGAGRR